MKFVVESTYSDVEIEADSLEECLRIYKKLCFSLGKDWLEDIHVYLNNSELNFNLVWDTIAKIGYL